MKNRILLLKKIVFAAGFVLLMAGSAEADLVAINNIAPNAGTYSGFSSTGTGPWSFTGTADYDGGGIADTLSFDLTRTTYGMGSISGADVTVGSSNTGGNTNNWYSNFGNIETLQLEVSNIMYTSGEMDGTTAVFAGFTNFTRVNFGSGAGDVDIDYLIHTGPVGSTTFTSAMGTTDVDLTSAGSSNVIFVTAEAGAGGIRIRDVDLQFETVAVPEPSSIMLLGLALSGLAFRRRV